MSSFPLWVLASEEIEESAWQSPTKACLTAMGRMLLMPLGKRTACNEGASAVSIPVTFTSEA